MDNSEHLHNYDLSVIYPFNFALSDSAAYNALRKKMFRIMDYVFVEDEIEETLVTLQNQSVSQ